MNEPVLNTGPVPLRSRRSRQAFAVGLALVSAAGVSSATVVERVVAVVGEQAILLSELRDRAKPFLMRLEQQASGESQRAAATSQLYGQLVQRLIEEELEQKAAVHANINVTAREVDDALGRIAAQNNVSIDRVVEEATRTGLTEASYRQELKRQLLEAKLINLRTQNRLRVSEDDLHAAYQKLVVDERKQLGFRAAWIRISAPHSMSPAEMKARRAKVDEVANAARHGEDFSLLAKRYSDDNATKPQGGSLGSLKPGQLPPNVDAVALELNSGDVSEPFRHGDDFVILKVLGRDDSQLPAYNDAKDELSQRVYMEKMNRARQRWLDGLRRQTHVEVRL